MMATIMNAAVKFFISFNFSFFCVIVCVDIVILTRNIFVLLRYRKFSVILVPVGKGKGDDVVASTGDVELDAVGRVG